MKVNLTRNSEDDAAPQLMCHDQNFILRVN